LIKTNDKFSYCHTSANTNLISKTIGDLLNDQVKDNPDKVGYIFPHNDHLHLTFSDVKNKAEIMANNLLQMGLVKGNISSNKIYKLEIVIIINIKKEIDWQSLYQIHMKY
jgi:hypothetical protein